MKSYFNNIKTLGELKKEFRKLVLENHPDRGGNTEVMQVINEQFQKLYDILKGKADCSQNDNTGYTREHYNYTTKQYAKRVYEEYGWKGSRADEFKSGTEMSVVFKQWIRKTYPNLKFSVCHDGRGTHSYTISWMQADFCPFIDENDRNHLYAQLNHYNIDKTDFLNDRAKDILLNILSYIQSYNYDYSDTMTDYFNVGFYLSLNIGTFRKNFVFKPLELKAPKGTVYKAKIGEFHKAVAKAIGKDNVIAEWWRYHFSGDVIVWKRHEEGKIALFKKCEKDEHYSCPIDYSQPSLVEKKLSALKAVGILAHDEGSYRFRRIIIDGYTEEYIRKMKEEDKENDRLEKEFYLDRIKKLSA